MGGRRTGRGQSAGNVALAEVAQYRRVLVVRLDAYGIVVRLADP